MTGDVRRACGELKTKTPVPAGASHRRCEFAEVMRADAGFGADQARRYVAEPRFHLDTLPLLPHHDSVARILDPRLFCEKNIKNH